ncbi:MAG: amino acid adenylation domain-containing protein [Clostridium sp.]
MGKVNKMILEGVASGKIKKDIAIDIIKNLNDNERDTNNDIAVIGMSIKFPMADNLNEFWNIIDKKVNCTTNFPVSRSKDAEKYLLYTNSYGINKKSDISFYNGAYLKDIDRFDYDFFNISPSMAKLMDPAQRIFLQTAYHAIEDAGYGGNRLDSTNTGVYVGYAGNVKDNYSHQVLDVKPDLVSRALEGNIPAIIPTRISYFLNLKGPTMVVDTACSSSLVAIHLACKGILNGDCDMAIAGGIKLFLLPIDNKNLKIGIESSDGLTHSFNYGSDGSGIGEGVAAIVLKPLKKAEDDGDDIYAVIKGSAINQDGKTQGITAPNFISQEEAIIKAWDNASINPEKLGFIEVHGTATKLGDPVEIEGIKKAFSKYTQKKQFCSISTIKSNVNHLYESSGIAGFIKAILSINNKKIPAMSNFERINPIIQLQDSPIYINTHPRKWESKGEKRICGISSFGLSGTNCHMILEEYKKNEVKKQIENKFKIFTISARDEVALNNYIKLFINYLGKCTNEDFDSICYTSNVGRGHYEKRVAIIAENIEELRTRLNDILINKDNFYSDNYIFYGSHSVISVDKKEKSIGEITYEEKKNITNEVNNLLQNNYDSLEFYIEICKRYVLGADVNWKGIYRIKINKIHMPLYPFNEKRCWIDIPQLSENDYDFDNKYHKINWIKCENSSDKTIEIKGDILVFSENDVLDDTVINRLSDINIINVKFGKENKKISDNHYIVTNSDEGYRKLFSNIDVNKLACIVHASTMNMNHAAEDICELSSNLNKGVYSLFNIVRELDLRTNRKIRIFILTSYADNVTGDEKVIIPENESLIGIGKVIEQEYSNLICKAIDIDKNTQLNYVIDEIFTENKYYLSAYRNNVRYIEEFCDIVINQNDKKIALNSEGVYLITGGIGGIGTEIIKFIAKMKNVNIAIVGRTTIPEKEKWNEILHNNENIYIKEKIENLKDLLSLPVKIHYYSADVSNYNEMQNVIEEIRKKYKKINGVIHCAGNAGAGYMAHKTINQFDYVIKPKIYGTWILDKLLKNDDLEFFVLFSSGVTITGEVGQSDYVVANSYLDSFCNYRRKLGKCAHTINWVSWKNAGMSVKYGVNVDAIFKALDTNDALLAFERVICNDVSRVIVGEINRKPEFLYILGKVPIKLNENLQSYVETNAKKGKGNTINNGNYDLAIVDDNGVKLLPKSNKITNKDNKSSNVVLQGRSNNSYSNIEKAIAQIYSEVLGYDKINIYDNFFDLGGDSIFLTYVYKLLDRDFPGLFKLTDLFQYTSVYSISEYIENYKIKCNNSHENIINEEKLGEDIAIIGISAIVPNGESKDVFWKSILNKIDNIREFPSERKKDIDNYLNQSSVNFQGYRYLKGSYIDNIKKFDYEFFRITPLEAKLMDPSHRLFLKTVYHSVEDAGYNIKKLSGKNIGIYLGYSKNSKDDYHKIIYDTNKELTSYGMTGNLPSMIPARISYLYNFKGPAIVVDSACSSSLVAIHLACQGLRNGDCDMAIAGGVRLNLIPVENENFKIGVESEDYYTRTFDNASNGAGNGEGIASIILKPLSRAKKDKDNIYAIIKGSAVNQDGQSLGITAPNVEAQEKVITKAWENAGINPEKISYMEVHGTATKLGDPIEISAIERAFRKFTNKSQFCAVSSLKTNLGHLNESAGIMGFIKAVLAIKNKVIPPSIHFDRPNKKINFPNSPVYVNTKPRYWNSCPRICGVSAFGLSGTNCHMILQEYIDDTSIDNKQDQSCVFTLSANSIISLRKMLNEYKNFLMGECDFQNLCYTSNLKNGDFRYKIAIYAYDKKELLESINKILELDFRNIEEQNIYFNDSKSDNNVSDVDKLTYEINKSNLSNTDRVSLLNLLCKGYVHGIEIDWEKIYYGVKKISIPEYIFDEEDCWVDTEKVNCNYSNNKNIQEYYTLNWHVKESTICDEIKNKKIIIITRENCNNNSIFDYYQKSVSDIVNVSISTEYKKINDNLYNIRSDYRDIEKMLSNFIQDSEIRIIYLPCLDYENEISTLEDLKESQHNGVIFVFNIIKVLQKLNIQCVDLSVILNTVNRITGEEKKLCPEMAPIIGLIKSATRECTNIKLKCIDVDTNTNVKSIVNEIECGNEILVAYRSNVRYTELLEECKINSKNNNIPVKKDGVYIITGGFGGMGIEIASYISKVQKVVFIFLNRNLEFEHEEWKDIVKNNNDKQLVEKVNKLIKIEENGSIIEGYQVDICDLDKMKLVIESVKNKYGTINGVIHCAGVSFNKKIIDTDELIFEDVIKAKIYGTWIMNKLTEKEDMDFFIMSSSIATIFGAPNQSAYAAANAFLDSYAEYRNSLKKSTQVINWTTWKETGMSYRSGFTIDTIFKAMTTEDAISRFDTIFRNNISGVIIGEFNNKNGVIQLINKSTVQLSNEVRSKLLNNIDMSPKMKDIYSDVMLLGKGDKDYTQSETIIAKAFNESLEYQKIDIDDNFFEMGIDSIGLSKIHSYLENKFPGAIKITDFFQYPTIRSLAKHLRNDKLIINNGPIDANKEKKSDDIAIIGIDFNFPLAKDVSEFWTNIRCNIDCIKSVNDERKKDIRAYLNAKGILESDIQYISGGYLDEIDKFDYKFFNMSYKEACLTDPNQRKFMETAFRALEDAGYSGKNNNKGNVGIYLGFSPNIRDLYSRMIYETNFNLVPQSIIGNTNSVSTGRLSYLLDLHGPSMVIDTACSSSLVAVDTACQAIRNGSCDMAIAGGVKLTILPVKPEKVDIGIGMDSTDGRTRTFDNKSDGTGTGEGVGAIVLKPLDKAIKDKDNIYAIIKGSAVNQDGNSIGLTAPNPNAQEEVIEKACKNANIKLETIDYIEAHGTGTKLGDSIEIRGIKGAFEKNNYSKQMCAISSIKTNIGHLSEASGIAGIIKAIIALNYKEIPSQGLFKEPNKEIQFTESPVYVNTRNRYWKRNGHPRRCGVSGFGISGTNCNVIIEEYIADKKKEISTVQKDIFTLSAKTETSLKNIIRKFIEFLKDEDQFNNICFTTNTRKEDYDYRLAIIADSCNQLKEKLIKLEKNLKTDSNEFIFFNKISKDKLMSEVNNISYSDELTKLCYLYIYGSDIDWNKIYKDSMCHRIRIPLYEFDNKKCWIDFPDKKNKCIVESGKTVNNNVLSKIFWKEEEINNNKKSSNICTLVIKNKRDKNEEKVNNIINKLTSINEKIVEVEFGSAYEKINNNKYIIRNTEEDYVKLIRDNNMDISTILHMSSLYYDNDVNNIEELKNRINYGLFSLLHLVKALLKVEITNKIQLVIVGRYAYSVSGSEICISPEIAAMFGLAKVITLEYSNINTKCIDIDVTTSAQEIIDEINYGNNNYRVAYRKGKRYTEEYGYINDTVEEDKISIKNKGVYVITGGTGGIGLEIASNIASKEKVNIILISRSGLPDKNLWNDEFISKCDKETSYIIRTVKEIEYSGSKVEICKVNVADYSEVEYILEYIRKKYGSINGIVHCAGVVNDGFLVKKSDKDFEEVISPKIYGTWILDQLTRKDNIDFFIMSSSISVIASEPGQGDYIAASSYLDSYAYYRKKITNKKSLSIGWSAWKETGMAVKCGLNKDGLFMALKTLDAIDYFNKIINKDITQVYVGKLNSSFDNISKLKDATFNISSEIKDILNTNSEEEIDRSKYIPLKLIGKKKFTKTEKILGKIWQKEFGINEINIEDDFFELGGDSISSLRISNSINKEFNTNLSSAIIMNYPQFERLAEYIEINKIETEKIDNNKNVVCRSVEKLDENIDLEEVTVCPISPIQKGMFYLQQFNNISTTYNMPEVCIIEGNLDVSKLERTFKTLIKRHEIFRSTFEIINGEPMRKVYSNIKFKINNYEYQEKEFKENYKEILSKFVKPFNISKLPLIRVNLIKIKENKYILFYDMNHIISDGTSNRLIQNEIASIYNGKKLPELKLEYKDYVNWYIGLQANKKLKEQEEYWMKKFKDEIPVLNLVTDFMRPLQQDFSGSHIWVTISEELTLRIRNFVADKKVTLYTVLLSALDILLWIYTGQDDIIIGSPVSGRILPEFETLIGMFVNTIAIRNKVIGNKKIIDFVEEVKNNCIEAYANQLYPYEELVEKLNCKPEINRNAIFDVMLILQNYGVKEDDVSNIDNIKIIPNNFEYGDINSTSKFDISINAVEYDKNIKLNFEYRTNLFRRDTIERFAQYYVYILEEIISNENKEILEININSRQDNELINKFNSSYLNYDKDKTIIDLFDEQVIKTPDNIAIIFDNVEITYKELSDKVNKLAHLLKNNGMERNKYAVIMIDKSIEMIIAILAVLKSEGAYIPIDGNCPKARIEYILKQSKSILLLTQEKYSHKVSYDGKIIVINEEIFSTNEVEEIINNNTPNDIAYVIYTSGTTGEPKGVMVEHKNLMAYVFAFKKQFNISYKDVIMQQASVAFDAFVEEVYPILITGGKIVIIKNEDVVDMKKLTNIINERKISIISCSPLLLSEINKVSRLESVHTFISGGDVLKFKYINKLINYAEVYNSYGPTETTVCATYYRCTDELNDQMRIPIGKPISNYKVYIMNKELNNQPIGVPGELCISGDGVSSGYLDNTELTEKVYVENPYEKGQRLYKTGDLARWLLDGNIEFLGRMDSQVKIRGYRIETKEIEFYINSIDKIHDNVVVPKIDGNNEKCLCAYYVAEEEISIGEIRKYLSSKLPQYMIPTFFIKIPKIPVNSNGKVDYKVLPSPINKIVDEKIFVPVQGEIENKIHQVWSELLNITSISATENFFDIGGNSINAIQIVAKLQVEYDINVNDIFEHQTIRELAKNVLSNKNNLKKIVEKIKYNNSNKNIIEEKEYLSKEEVSNKINSYNLNNNKYKNIDLDRVKVYKNILLTGVTGYLGIYLLKDLLSQTQSNIYVLIRGKNLDIAEKKLNDNVEYYLGKKYNSLIKKRVRVINGDLSKTIFGLDEKYYSDLSKSIDCIIHAAANTNHYGIYEEFYKDNVVTTENLVNFALINKTKDFNYISTISVGSGKIDENNYFVFTEEDYDVGQKFKSYYDKSKFEAENVVRDAIKKGLNVKVFRIGNLVFDSTNYKYYKDISKNVFLSLIKSAIRIGNIPDIKYVNMDFSFIDIVSKSIISLFDKEELVNETFHIFNHKLTNMIELVKMINDSQKYDIKIIPIDEFLYNIINSSFNEDISNVLVNSGLLDINNDTEFKILDSKTSILLDRLSITWNKLNINNIDKLFEYLNSLNYFK